MQHGERDFTFVPPFHDPMDLGTALIRWWNAMQPSFRQSPEGSQSQIPSPVYQSPDSGPRIWAPIIRSGPSGFVSILIILCWWGHALPLRKQFQEDSRPLWDQMVVDVGTALGHMQEEAKETIASIYVIEDGQPKRKLPVEDKAPGRKKKRYAFSL